MTRNDPLKVAYIFTPPWDPEYPSYAMALFSASTDELGETFYGFDLNVDLYHAADMEDKQLWVNQHAVRWNREHVQIIEKYSDYLRAYVDGMIRERIELFGIYANCLSKHVALYLAQEIKQRNRRAGVILGGPQCLPAGDGIRILDHRSVDAICTGEGDLLWPEILGHYQRHGNLFIDLPGIAYRNSEGEIIDGGTAEMVADLEAIPCADYSKVDLSKYGNKYQVGIMTSRGCINTCAFCSDRTNFNSYRSRKAEGVFEEISVTLEVIGKAVNQHKDEGLIEAEVTPLISFNDSLINGNLKELERLCDLIIESGKTFHWGGMALFRKGMTTELLAKMKQAGCVSLSWGLESGSQRTLDLMNKRISTIALAKGIIRSAFDIGFYQTASIIVGFPGETEEMFLETLEFIREHRKYFSDISAQPMQILCNSRVYDRHEEFGIDQGNSRDCLKWRNMDDSNNYEIRLERLERLNAILGGNLSTIDK